jgi:hypothetical protein
MRFIGPDLISVLLTQSQPVDVIYPQSRRVLKTLSASEAATECKKSGNSFVGLGHRKRIKVIQVPKVERSTCDGSPRPAADSLQRIWFPGMDERHVDVWQHQHGETNAKRRASSPVVEIGKPVPAAFARNLGTEADLIRREAERLHARSAREERQCLDAKYETDSLPRWEGEGGL